MIRCDGHGIPELLEDILQLLPLDRSTEKPVQLMQVFAGETVETPIWNIYGAFIAKHDDRGEELIKTLEH